MTTEKVIKIHPDEKYYAKCPECNGTSWGLLLNGVGDNWDNITGTECLNPDCGFVCEWIKAERVDKPKPIISNDKTNTETQKVVHIKDSLGSIQHLQGLIEGIRDGVVVKFICIDQASLEAPDDCKIVDAYGRELEIGEKFSSNCFYFFGDCPASQLVGLSSRMTYILNQSMDGIDVISDSSFDED